MSVTDPATSAERIYRVNEIFYSLQGEGFHTGRPAVFLRFSGCNRSCPFCDTQHQSATQMSAADIIGTVSRWPARFIVVTGGEPLMQLDDTLIRALHDAGFTIAVETNGSLPAPEGIDWITCSPKEEPWRLQRCDELKVLFTDEAAIERADSSFEATHHFIQPLYDAATGTTNAPEAIDYIKRHPRWRLSLQTHRLLNIR